MNFKNFFGFICGFGLMTTSAFALPKASEIYPDMGLGYNIGNTMEVPKTQGGATGWGNVVPNADIINGIKAAGFNTIRIPCAWDTYATNGTIDASWLATVKGVVDLAIEKGMYVMLNSHWDGGWLEDHVFDGKGFDKNGETTSSAEAVAAKQESYWTQIATYFKDYDEHLIFASANEPGVNDPESFAFSAERAKVLQQFHESCLKAVRATGGNNATRTVIVQMPRTDTEFAQLLKDNYPADPAGEGYTMAEFHYYPYQLSFMANDESWGKIYYYWEDATTGSDPEHTCSGSDPGSKSSIEKTFSKMQQIFVDDGIPVVIGEMGIAVHYDLSGDNLKKHQEARAAWYGYTVAAAKNHGLVPVIWDQGYEGTDVIGSDGKKSYNNFTVVRRQSRYGTLGAVVDEPVMNAMKTQFAAAEGYVPPVPQTFSPDDKAMWLEMTSKTAEEAEQTRIQFSINGQDWSKYSALSFQVRVEGSSAGPCTGAGDGCNGYSWVNLSAFAMSGSGWVWTEVKLGQIADFSGCVQTVKISLNGTEEPVLQLTNSAEVNAFGIYILGTQFSGTMYLDNLVLYKADGTTDTLTNFNTAPSNMEISGPAGTPTYIQANAKGTKDGSATSPITSSSSTVLSSSSNATNPSSSNSANVDDGTTAVYANNGIVKFNVNVLPGSVQAMFSTLRSGNASAILMNSLGQVIAQQNFTAKAGSNTVQLKSSYRGPALLIIKQGSQRFSRKIILK